MLQKMMFKRISLLVLPMVAALMTVGCADADWDWMRRDASTKKSDKPVTRAANTPRQNPPQTARAEPQTAAAPEDAQAREVDERVARYVESMNTQSDSGYVHGDLNSKIQRQNDPERANRIRQTAARARGDHPGYSEDGSQDASQAREDHLARDLEPREAAQSAGQPQESHAQSNSPPSQAAQASDRPSEAQSPTRNETIPTVNIATEKGDAAEETIAESPIRAEPNLTNAATDEKPAAADADPTRTAKPPVLSEISISPSASNNSPDASTGPDRSIATEPAPDRVHVNAPPATVLPAVDPIRHRITEQEKLVAREPDNLEEQFRLRLLYLIDGQDDKAMEPTPGVNEEIQEIMQGQVRALMAARSTSERDPALWANRQLDAIEDLRAMVRARADLRVPRVELCSAIDGFGRYEPIVPAQFAVGGRNQVIVYMEIDNFQTEKTATGLFRTLMSVRASLLNKSGEEIWSMRDENIEDLARQRRSDFFLTIGPLAIPKTLGPGEYVMKIEVEDVIGGKIGSNFAKFKMLP